MKKLSLDTMSSIEGGIPCAGYTGKYCPLAFMVLLTGFKSSSLFAVIAGLALKNALCTPCGGDSPT